MDVKEPVVLLPAPVQPIERDRQYLFARFQPAAADVVALVEARIEPPGGVALREGAHRDGMQPGTAEDVVKIPVVHRIAEIAIPSRQTAIRCRPAVADRSVPDAEHPADQSGPGGQAGSIGAVIPVKAHAVAADGVQIRRSRAIVAIAAHMVGPQGVNIEH